LFEIFPHFAFLFFPLLLSQTPEILDMDRMRFKLVHGLLLGGALLLSSAAFSQENQLAEPSTLSQPAVETNTNSQEILRSYLQIQEQLHTALLTIEQNRQQTDEAGRRNVETISARLKLIEQALTAQREREAESAAKSQRLVLIIAAVFGGLGLLAMVATAWFQLRAMNRLAQFTSAGGNMLGHHPMGSLGSGEGAVTSVSAMPLPNANLLGAIERLEKRFLELQSATRASLPTHTVTQTNGEPRVSEVSGAGANEGAERVSLLIGKGQALLNMDQIEDALKCFNEALEADPTNADALVKKGTALERHKKLEEAIDCYDRAIASNNGMTLAYLCKGGVYNQLERFSEALECYEQALRTQQKGSETPMAVA
jgi:tetratricopeptide (TPR) repeat protein